MPQGMLLNLDSHHRQQELFRNQINASEPLKKQLWQQTIVAKIENQSKLLQKMERENNPMDYYASKVLSGDTTNREGVAARLLLEAYI